MFSFFWSAPSRSLAALPGFHTLAHSAAVLFTPFFAELERRLAAMKLARAVRACGTPQATMTFG